MSDIELNAVRAKRATGAMFFSGFGSAWLGLWALQTFAHFAPVMAGIVALGFALFVASYLRYRKYRPDLLAVSDTPAAKRASRIFNWINMAQWILIVAVLQILPRFGLAAWSIPVAMFIIGVHFLPLARLFNSRINLFMGIVFIALATAYPWVASGGPADPIGCLGAGLVLWSGAIMALTMRPQTLAVAA